MFSIQAKLILRRKNIKGDWNRGNLLVINKNYLKKRKR